MSSLDYKILEKTSDYLSLFEEISHESVRIYYHGLKILKPKKRGRRLIAVDETKLEENNQIFVWIAID